jgi:hypothetical protein
MRKSRIAINPIVAAYLDDARKSVEERESLEMFISPEDEWLEYIEKDLIGFEYTRAQAAEAQAYIESRKG